MRMNPLLKDPRITIIKIIIDAIIFQSNSVVLFPLYYYSCLAKVITHFNGKRKVTNRVRNIISLNLLNQKIVDIYEYLSNERKSLSLIMKLRSFNLIYSI